MSRGIKDIYVVVKFEDINSTFLAGFLNEIVSKLFKDIEISVLIRFSKVAFGYIPTQSQMIRFVGMSLDCNNQVAKTLSITKLPEHQCRSWFQQVKNFTYLSPSYFAVIRLNLLRGRNAVS